MALGNRLSFKKIGYRLFIVISILTLVVTDNSIVSAITYNDRLLQDQIWFEKGCRPGGSSGSGSSGAPLEGSDNQQKVWNYFKSKGFSDAQTAAIMGNFAWESGDPTFNKATSSEEASGGGGFGIAQWTGSRRTEITNAAIRDGRPLTDLSFQLDYAYAEIQTRTERDGGTKTEEQGLKEISDVAKATEYFMYNHERPGDLRLKERTDFANQFLAKYGTGDNSTSAGSGSSGSSSGASCAAGGDGSNAGGPGAQCGEHNLIGVIKCYAWPQYKGSGFTEALPAYTEAVKKAQSEGRYVGGNSMPGIDCGGFITTVMIDSGFEPGYNNNGKGGPTATQFDWTSKNWTTLGKASSINVADLRPGDVANDRDNHTYMWVGPVDGFEPTNIASASLQDRAPMAGHENPTSGNFTWFGKR